MPQKKPRSAGLLFNLKEWLTLEDAAKHLSIVFGEEVTVADVLRLAIDRRLVLSVDFVNHGTVRKGKLIPLKECSFKVLPGLFNEPGKQKWRPPETALSYKDLDSLPPAAWKAIRAGDFVLIPDALAYRPDEFLVLENEISQISGIWDLPMLGGEALDVMHKYQMQIGGPGVTLSSLEGAFVERDGVVCQLQEDFDDNKYAGGSRASLQQLKRRIREDKLAKEQADELLAEHAELRRKFLERRREREVVHSYFPAGGLPPDVVWVVRTSALRTFEQAVIGSAAEAVKKVSPREESTLLNVIGALLGLVLGKTPSGKPQSVFKSQSAVIEALLAQHEGKPGISARTLEDKFAAAKKSLGI